MTVLVTGAAGFIGFHLSQALLASGVRVIGVDNVNDYYDVALKQGRLALLEQEPNFTFIRLNLAEHQATAALMAKHQEIETVAHLAAQAGVRYSLENPFAYVEANVMGHLSVMEACRNLPKLKHLVYASSSSVYGANDKVPFAVEDRVEQPVSLYAATKRADELMSTTYARLYGLPMTGLRFFTVYGPWGRPDMAYFSFTKAIFEDREIKVFNHGKMRRDFTYIDDVVAGILAALERPPVSDGGRPPHRVYNLGNNRAETLMRFLEVLENACGREAKKAFVEMQPGDVVETYADIGKSQADLGYQPSTSIEEGLPRFVAWYRDFYKI